MMQSFSLLFLRVTTAGLLFWWGLAKALRPAIGENVSNKFYGGMFNAESLLVGFGWAQVVCALLLIVGIFRLPLLWVQLAINMFVAASVWQSLIDPFWFWMGGEKPGVVNALFYPSAIVVAASLLLIAFRSQDSLALDRIIFQGSER
ncbi:MAG: hypothetical protein AAGB04_19365 [Pseudomonadota bacterium]